MAEPVNNSERPTRMPIVAMMKVLYDDMERGELFKYAYSMAYVTLLSLVPSLAVVFALASLFLPLVQTDTNIINEAKSFVLRHLAAGSGEQVLSHLESFLNNIDIKKIGLSGFAGMVVTLILLLRQIENALNRVFMVHQDRNMIARFIYFWTILTLGTFVATLGLGLLADFSINNLIPFLSKRNRIPSLSLEIASVLFGPAAVFGAFMFLYKVVPNCVVSARAAAIGSGVASAIFLFVTRFYAVYNELFTNYAAVYGALAAIPVFLFWIYLLWLITLFGSVVTWRSQEGFSSATDDKALGDLQPTDRLRNHHLQGVVPFILQLAILHRFHKGEGSAIGITIKELATRLALPSKWVLDGVELLRELGYIYVRRETTDAITDDTILSDAIFPTRPAERVSVEAFKASLNAGTEAWLAKWTYDWDQDLKSIVRSIHVASSAETTFGDLLQSQ